MVVSNRLYPGQTPRDSPAQIVDIRNKWLIVRGSLAPTRGVADTHEGIIRRLKLGGEPVQRCHKHLAPPVSPAALPLLERGLRVGLL